MTNRRPGDRVRHEGQRRVVVRVVKDDEGNDLPVVRYPDGHPLRVLSPVGGDVHQTAVRDDEIVDEEEAP